MASTAPSGIPTRARAELFRALGALLEPPGPEVRRVAGLLDLPGAPEAAEHTTLFLLNLYPYASVHLGEEGMLGGEARDRVAGFWRALGMTPPPEPDHLGALLGLFAALAEREEEATDEAERALLSQARTALLREQLLPWLPPFLLKVREVGDPFYAAWAALLEEALTDEWSRVAGAADDTLPLHLRALPDLPDPRSDGDGSGAAFLKALLAPARSGMIVTRLDLARAGRELDLGTRVGERAYVLKAFLSQDAPRTLTWLAQEAGTWADRDFSCLDPVVTDFWRRRAGATASLLDLLASAEAHEWTTPETRAESSTESNHA